MEEDQGQDRADTRGRKGREDGEWVDVALVQHAEHDVDGDERGKNQPSLVGQRGAEHRRGALKLLVNTGRQTEGGHGVVDVLGGLAERSARREVERDGGHRELAEVIDRHRC